MGWFGDTSEEVDIESKTVDSNGNINNNVIIQEARDTHSQMLLNERLLFATHLLVGAEILKLGIYIFHAIRKSLKKRYQSDKK